MNTFSTNVLYEIYCPKSDRWFRQRGSEKGGGGENSPISPLLDPCLRVENKPLIFRHLVDMRFIHLGLRPQKINHISPRCLKITVTQTLIINQAEASFYEI